MIKLFLQENKIYFEIISTVLLGIMAIYVSYQSNEIAKSQLTVAESQLQVDQAQLQVAHHAIQLQEQEQLPDVKANFRTIKHENGEESYNVEILNTGTDLYDLSNYIIAFLSIRELQVISDNKPLEQIPHLIHAVIPIGNYPESLTEVNDPNNGKMFTTKIKNTRELEQAFETFKSSQETKSRSLVSFIEKYLYVSYKDKFGKNHSKYYHFGPGGDAIPMDNVSGDNIFKLHQLGIEKQKHIDIDSIDKNKLERLWIDYGKDIVIGNSINYSS